MSAQLIVEDVTAGYRGIRALSNVSVELEGGSAVGLLGANGAGKTTLLRVISGELPATSGRVRFEGDDLGRMGPEARVRAGISHVLQGRHVFSGMTVRENLEMGAIARGKRERHETISMLLDKFPILAQKALQPAEQLSGGQQQLVVIGRAVMSRPRLLLMDEPSLGLAPVMFPILRDLVTWVRETIGCTVFLIEQHSTLALSIVERSYVIASGRIVRDNISSADAAAADLAAAYLGSSPQPQPPGIGAH